MTMKTLVELRKEQYQYNGTVCPHINNWKRNPYTWLKSRFYMESSALLVYLLLKTTIHPNTITAIYCLMGITGGILLAVPCKTTIILACLVFFAKGILDWTDGHYARITGKTSAAGNILDSYGSYVGWVCLWCGLGVYIADKSSMPIFYYLTSVVLVFFALNISMYSRSVLFHDYLTKTVIKDIQARKAEVKTDVVGKNGVIATPGIRKIFDMINEVFTPRARFVDLICLIILIETFSNVFVSQYIFIVFFVWMTLTFIAKFYVVARGEWVEKELQAKGRSLTD